MISNDDIISAIAERIAEAILAKLTPLMKEPCKSEYFSVEEICSMLKISKATFYRHKNLGYIKPATYVGRKSLFTQESIDDYLSHFCPQ